MNSFHANDSVPPPAPTSSVNSNSILPVAQTRNFGVIFESSFFSHPVSGGWRPLTGDIYR